MLVYDAGGMSACAVTLLYVAKRHKAKVEQVFKWGWDLGFDLKAHDALRSTIEGVMSASTSL